MNNFSDSGGEMAAKKPLSQDTLNMIKQAIVEAGGQAEVADMSGVSQSQVSRFVRGQDVKLSTAISILSSIGGGISPVSDQRQQIVCEPVPDYRSRINKLEDDVLDLKKQLLYQQTKIMTAVVAACKVANLSVNQAHALQRSVMDFENWQTEEQIQRHLETFEEPRESERRSIPAAGNE